MSSQLTGRRRRWRVVGVALATYALVAAWSGGAGAASGDGEAVFGSLCQGCHTIGGGKGAGPDLAGLADRRDRAWVEQMIVAPEKLIASGDATAKDLVAEYGMQMPNLGVTQTQADALLSFLGFADAAPTPDPVPTPEPEPEPTPEPTPATGDATRGKNLFKGSTDFEAGGPSCLSCHSIAGVGALGGGQIGPDLTDSFAKYGGVQGLRAALKTVPFPTMVPIFSRKPLTEREQVDLVAFLESAPDQARPSGTSGKLIGLSLSAAALITLIGLVVWHRRLPGVRKPLVNRSRGK